MRIVQILMLCMALVCTLTAQNVVTGPARMVGNSVPSPSSLIGLNDFNPSFTESTNTIDAMQFTYSQFSQQPPLPNPAADSCTAIYGGKFYVIGGYGASSTAYLNYTQVYNPSSHIWLVESPKPTPEWGAGCAVYGSKIYMFGGVTSATGQAGTTNAEVYDIIGNSWSSLTNLPVALPDGVMATTVGSFIYIMWQQYLYKFDPAASGGLGGYTALTSAPTGAQVQWAASGYVNVSGDDRVYFLGGSHGTSSLSYQSTVYYYSVTNDTWSSALSSAPYAAHGMVQQAVNSGVIYYLGGYDGSVFYQDLYSYTPSTDTWSSVLATMNAFRDGVGGGFFTNTIYAIGGRNAGNLNSPFGIFDNESFTIGSSPFVQTFTKIQLHYNQPSPIGSVRLGVYSDTSGQPGSLVLDAGTVSIVNGWTYISGLSLSSLTFGTKYWLVFVQNSAMAVSYTGGIPKNTTGSGNAHCFNTLSFGALPSTFPLSGINCSAADSMYAIKLTVM
jgi:hypothetical protein